MRINYFALAFLMISISFMGLMVNTHTEGALAFEDDILINNDAADVDQGRPDIAADGNDIHIVWQDRRNGNWDLYFRSSDDGGLNFGPEKRVDDTSITETLTDDVSNQVDPEISVGPDGTIWIVWSDDREGRPMIYMSRSTDGGGTFSSNYMVSYKLMGSQTLPHLDVSSTGKIMVVWEDTRLSIGHEQIFGAHAGSDGTFEDAVRISDTSVDHNCYNPRVAFTDDDNIHVVWTEDRLIDMDILICSSEDGGDTFLPSYIINRDPSSSDQDMSDIDANETAVVVVWKDSRTSSADIYITISNDLARSFPLEEVAHPLSTSGHQYEPEVGIEGDGNISICWTSSPGFNDQRSDIQMTRMWGNGSFDAVKTVNDAGVGITQDTPSLAVSNGAAHLVWRDYRTNSQADIYYTRTVGSGEEGEGPVLSGGIVNPSLGGLNEKYTFRVTYTDFENDIPVPGNPKLELYYRSTGGLLFPYPGSPFNMTMRMGQGVNFDYRDGETFIMTVTPTRELELYHRFNATALSGNRTVVRTPLVRGPILDFEGPVITYLEPAVDEWKDSNIVDFTLEISDELSGVDPWSISYQRYNLATGAWESWQRKGTSEIIDNNTVKYTVNIVLFGGDENQVRFRAKDKIGNGEDENGYTVTDTFNVWVDPTGPFFRVNSPRSGQRSYDTEVAVDVTVWDLGSGLDLDSINVSYSLGGPDNYGEWMPISGFGANISEDPESEGGYNVKLNLSFAYGYNNFFRFSARDHLGHKSISNGVQVVIEKEEIIIEDRPPYAVSSIQPKVSGSVRPHITWAPTYDPDGDLVSYWMKITDVDTGEPILDWKFLGPGITYFDPDQETTFSPSKTYLIEIVPEANGLNGTAAESILLISNDANMPPSPVTGLEPKATSDPSPTLRWDESVDQENETVLYFIRIGTFYNGGDIQEWTTTYTDPKFVVDRILGAGMYHIQIICSDGRDFSPISHFTLSIGIYSPLVESERTSIVIYPPEDEIKGETDIKFERVELKIYNRGFTFDNIKIRLDGEATRRDDIDIYTENDLLEISPGSSMNATLMILVNENTEIGIYTLNVTVTSLDGVSSFTKALSVRIVDPADIGGIIGSGKVNEPDDTGLLLWLFFAVMLIVLFAMGYAYYRIDRRQREMDVDVIPSRKGTIRSFPSGKKDELKGNAGNKRLKGKGKEKIGLPPKQD